MLPPLKTKATETKDGALFNNSYVIRTQVILPLRLYSECDNIRENVYIPLGRKLLIDFTTRAITDRLFARVSLLI